MARTIATPTTEAIEPSLQYLRRAFARGGDVFRHKPAVVRSELAELEEALSRAHADAKPLVLKDWISLRLTDAGRVRMVNALRRRRADAKVTKRARRTLTLPAATIEELDALAGQVGLPVTKMLAAFAAIGRVDAKLREQMVMLSVATTLTR
jgi:hypothetical protein